MLPVKGNRLIFDTETVDLQIIDHKITSSIKFVCEWLNNHYVVMGQQIYGLVMANNKIYWTTICKKEGEVVAHGKYLFMLLGLTVKIFDINGKCEEIMVNCIGKLVVLSPSLVFIIQPGCAFDVHTREIHELPLNCIPAFKDNQLVFLEGFSNIESNYICDGIVYRFWSKADAGMFVYPPGVATLFMIIRRLYQTNRQFPKVLFEFIIEKMILA